MSSTLFSLFDRVLLNEESLQFTVGRGANGTLTVLLQPVLKASTESFTDEVQSIRAALATPLYLTLNPAELDARFDDLVGAAAAARAELRTSYDTLMQTLREANKSAQSQTAQKRAASSTASRSTMKPRAPAQPVAAAAAEPDTDTDTDTEESQSTSPSASAPTPTSPAAPRGAATEKERDLFSSLTEATGA